MLFPDVNPVCADDGRLGGGPPRGLVLGGALPWEANHSRSHDGSLTVLAVGPSLEDIQAVMKEVGASKTGWPSTSATPTCSTTRAD